MVSLDWNKPQADDRKRWRYRQRKAERPKQNLKLAFHAVTCFWFCG
jgi:hypothetical protein